MGNKCSEAEISRAQDCQFGNINQAINASGTSYDTVFYSFRSFRKIELEHIENYWQAVRELKSEHIIRPKAVSLEDKTTLFIRSYFLKVEFADYNRTLESYVKETLHLNPLIAEIVVLKLLSDIIDALMVLQEEGIKHENISPQTIFLDFNGSWLLATPNDKVATLKKRIAENKERLTFLLAPEIAEDHFYDPFLADVYSLGVTVLNVLSPFGEPNHGRQLQESETGKALDAISPYYSRQLLKLLKGMTAGQATKRMNLRQALEFLNSMRDL